VRAQPAADLGLQRVGEAHTLDEANDAGVVVPLLADGQRLQDLGQLVHLAVDLGRADAHSTRVQGGVGTSMDHEATVVGP